jgi:hypothetical protein
MRNDLAVRTAAGIKASGRKCFTGAVKQDEAHLADTDLHASDSPNLMETQVVDDLY